MKLTEKVFKETLEQLSRIPNPQEIFRADNTSSFPDLLSWKIHPELLKSSRKTALTVVALSFMAMNPFQEENVRKRLLVIADKFNNEGQWSKVRKLLTLETWTPYYVLEAFLEDRSAEDFFGNDIQDIKRIIQHGIKWVNLDDQKVRVKTPQRKRGYDDKGHLPESTWGEGNTTKPIPMKPKETLPEISPQSNLFFEDLSMISDWEENEQETLVEKTTSKKIHSRISTRIDVVD